MNITPTNDRGVYEVTSQTGSGDAHRVDVEEFTCTCERVMEFGDTICPHLEAVFQTRAAQMRQPAASAGSRNAGQKKRRVA